MVTSKVLLFDIDGTLLRSGGAGLRSMARACAERFGVADDLRDIVPDGKTDPAILREILVTRGLWEGDGAAHLDALTKSYQRLLAEEMPRSGAARLMPGVRTLLEALRGRVPLGLLTGNFEVTARIKLDHFGLGRFFPFGAFASDDERRERLVPIAVARAGQHLGHTIGLGPHVVVIGDTPRDVECALANGVTALGVGAANYSAAELRAAGAHVVLEDLSDSAAVMAALGVG